MKKILFLLMFLISTNAFAYKETYNPHTGKLDKVGIDSSGDIGLICDSGNVPTSAGAGVWGCAAPPGASGGEANTASNLGGGLSNYDSKLGVDLRFNSFKAADFDLSSNLLSLDYVNGQLANTSRNGFMPSQSMTSIDVMVAKSHDAVTLAGSNYLTLSGQQITAGDVALTTHTSGNYVGNVATTSPLTGGSAGSEGASLTLSMPVANATTNGYMPSNAMASIDAVVLKSHDSVTLAGTNAYLTLSGQQITMGDVPLGTSTSGNYAAGDAEAGNATGLACTTCVDASDIASDAVTEAKLKAVDAASDEDILTYETTTGDFEWHSRDEIVGGISAGALPNDSVLEADLKAVDAASDEECLTYETTTGDFEWQACGSGGSGSTALNLPIYSAKLTGAFTVFTPPTADACSQGAQIDAGDGNWRLLFDATTDECATWQFVVPDNYSSTPALNVYYTMSSATSLDVEFEASIMCVTSGDSADIGTASFSNVATATETVPGTAGYMKKLTITLTDDSCSAGDIAFVVLSTDANDATNDDATGDREVVGVEFDYA